MSDYDAAIDLYDRCLTINPKNPSTLTSLGYAHHLRGDLKEALNYYHKSDYLRSDDAFTKDLINRALEDVNNVPMESVYLEGQSI